MAEQIGQEQAATTPATPVGSTRAAISAVTLMMSAGWALLICSTLMTSLAVMAVLATVDKSLKNLTMSWFLSQRALMSLNFPLSWETKSVPSQAPLASAVASPLAPNVAMLMASMPTLTTWLKVVLAQANVVVAAPIPHSTQPLGGPSQHTGPTPVQPALHLVQQSPPCCYSEESQIMGLGSPMMIFLAQEMSNWEEGLKPKLEQLKGLGLQMQHPKAQYPALHLGQAIAPHISQLPLPLSFSQREIIPLLLKPSFQCQPQPAPRPYSTSRQKSPWSSNPPGQFWWQSNPTLEQPAGHLEQQRSPIFSLPDEQVLRGVPAPRTQESLQQKVDWLLKICCCDTASRNKARTILYILQILLYSFHLLRAYIMGKKINKL